MFFALDENGVRVNAEDGIFSNCVCPACRNPVKQRRGDTNRHHFAHIKKDLSCPFEYNKDYVNMSEWHIRMQGYFPKKHREHIFTDMETGEKHIADVYIEEINTVLEFQYSSLKKQEFLDRTMFHLKEGRRLVWLFDESWKNSDEKSYNKTFFKFGKLEKAYNRVKGPYSRKSYRWLYRRKFVEDGPPLYRPNYSVCVFTGAEGDVFHRILSLDKDHIIISLHDITMSKELNIEEFFRPETYWQEQSPWNETFEPMGEARPFDKYDSPEKKKQAKTFIEETMDLEELRHLRIQEFEMKKQENERLYREDYWAALLDSVESGHIN